MVFTDEELGPYGFGRRQIFGPGNLGGSFLDFQIGGISRRRPVGVVYPRLSVGERTVPVQPTRPSVPDVVPETRLGKIYPDLPEIDRRDKPSNKTDVRKLKPFYANPGTLDYFEVAKLRQQGYQVLDPSGGPYQRQKTTPASGPTPATMQTSPGRQESDMDLGTLATDLLRQAGTAYIQRELAPRQQMQMPVGYTPAFDIPFTDMGVEADIPFIDVVQRQKCKRKRRRPIATPSEISQLASLKQVASPGEVKLFLAKRLRT